MQGSEAIRLKPFALQNLFLLCETAVILRKCQLGTKKTLLESCLLLLTESANNILPQMLPVLCCSSCAYVICPALTLAVTQIQVHVDILCMHVSTHKHKLNTYHFPRHFIYFLLAQLPRAGKSQRKQSCCCLSWLGASCPDRGPSRDIPERSCWNRGGKAECFGLLSMTYNLIVFKFWYASASWAHFWRMCYSLSAFPLHYKS